MADGCVQLRHARFDRCDAAITPTAGAREWTSSADFVAASLCRDARHTLPGTCPGFQYGWKLLPRCRLAAARLTSREVGWPRLYSREASKTRNSPGGGGVGRCCSPLLFGRVR